MKKLKLKKITLAEMPSEAMDKVNGGNNEVKSAPITTISLISLYTYSIIASACDDCASSGCNTRYCQQESKASYCLCTG